MTGRKNNSPVDYVMPDGTTRTFASINALAEELGMSYRNAYAQVFKHKSRRKRPVVWQGKTYASIAQMAREAFDPPVSREYARQLLKKAENGAS